MVELDSMLLSVSNVLMFRGRAVLMLWNLYPLL